MMKRRQLTVMVGASVMVMGMTACANRVAPEILQSAAYQTGYSDGCLTGNRGYTGFKKDVQRNEAMFRSNENYAIGWRQGYSVCGGSQEAAIERDPEFLTTDRFDRGPI